MSDTLPERVTRLEALAENTHEALLRIERRMEAGFAELRGEMHGGFARLDGRIDQLTAQARSDLWRLLGAGAGATVAVIVAMAWMLRAAGHG